MVVNASLLETTLFKDGELVSPSTRHHFGFVPGQFSAGATVRHEATLTLPSLNGGTYFGWHLTMIAGSRSEEELVTLKEWLPLHVIVQGPDRSSVGPRSPAMLYLGITDCPSVTWIPNWSPETITAWLLMMRRVE